MDRLQAGVVIAAHGAAIVTARINGKDEAVVIGIDRLPFSIDDVGERIAQIATERKGVRFTIDSEGLGTAMYTVLVPGRRQGNEPYRLLESHGLDRQKLVDALVVLVHFDQLRFAAGLEQQAAMTKALIGYNRQVREDGQIGSELVTALCLAIAKPSVRRGGYAFYA
jgi:hypothetical protein